MVKFDVDVEDVGGSCARLFSQAPKLARKMLGTAVFMTARRVLGTMEATAPMGPDGQGLTPDEHIRLDLEENWTASRPLSARVGILNNDAQAHVALYNEYSPDRQPFMKSAALTNEASFQRDAIMALQSIERKLAGGIF